MRYADAFCTYKEQFKPEHAYVFTGPCVFSGNNYTVVVPAKQLFEYRRNPNLKIQDAFPEMDPGDREFLMNGASPKAFDELFSEDEEDEICEECGRTKKDFMKSSGHTLTETFGCPKCDDDNPETD